MEVVFWIVGAALEWRTFVSCMCAAALFVRMVGVQELAVGCGAIGF